MRKLVVATAIAVCLLTTATILAAASASVGARKNSVTQPPAAATDGAAGVLCPIRLHHLDALQSDLPRVLPICM